MSGTLPIWCRYWSSCISKLSFLSSRHSSRIHHLLFPVSLPDVAPIPPDCPFCAFSSLPSPSFFFQEPSRAPPERLSNVICCCWRTLHSLPLPPFFACFFCQQSERACEMRRVQRVYYESFQKGSGTQKRIIPKQIRRPELECFITALFHHCVSHITDVSMHFLGQDIGHPECTEHNEGPESAHGGQKKERDLKGKKQKLEHLLGLEL